MPRWFLLGCLLAILLVYSWNPKSIFARGTIQAQEPILVTQEIRYIAPKAGEVFLVWGVDGWNTMTEEIRPAGTEIKNGAMHTPMKREGDTFVAQVRVPVGAMLDYGFLITKGYNGANIEALWDGDYQTNATQDDIVEVEATVTLSVVQEIRYHLPEAGEVFLVWGSDGWGVVPEAIRPAGTVVKDALMYTPMEREGGTFIARIQVPVGTTIDYGFLITKKRDGTEIRTVWDGGEQDYRIIATEDDVIEMKPSPTLAQAMEFPTILDVGLYLLAGLGVVLVLGVVFMRIPGQHNSRMIILVLIVLILVGLALRLGVVSTTDRLLNTPAQLIGDESRYDSVAYALRQGEFFQWPGVTPVYPLFLAGAYLIFGHSYAGALYLQAFVGAMTIPLTYRLARRFTGRRSSLLATMLVALHPNLIGQTAILYTEVLYTPLLLLALLGLLWALEAPFSRRFILAGALLGIANFVRPATALLPLFLPLILPRVWSLRRRVTLWVVYSVAMVAVIIPWTYHNYRTHNTFLPFSLTMVQVWTASPEFYHLMKQKPNAIVRIWDEELNPERNGGHDPLTIEGDRYFTARGIASIRAEPGIYAWYSLQKLAFFWIGHPAADYDWPFNFVLLRKQFSAGWIATLFGFRLLLVVATLVGLIILRHRLRDFAPLLLICGYLMLVYALLLPVARYSEPLYPILTVIIAAAVSKLIDRYHAHRQQPVRADIRESIPPILKKKTNSVIVIMPAYNAAKTLEKTYASIPMNIIDKIILTDDVSHDETVEIARQLGLKTIIHVQNKGYGGNQKTCYIEALKDGAEIVVMLHPDNQYDATRIPTLIEPIQRGEYDMMIGSRLLGEGTLEGGMPLYKYISNRFLTWFENLVLGQNLSEYHSGFRAYSREVLTTIPFLLNSDDFVFDSEVLAQVTAFNFKIGEVPVPTRYFKEASSINFRRSVVYGLSTMWTMWKYLFCKWGLSKNPQFVKTLQQVTSHYYWAEIEQWPQPGRATK